MFSVVISAGDDRKSNLQASRRHCNKHFSRFLPEIFFQLVPVSSCDSELQHEVHQTLRFLQARCSFSGSSRVCAPRQSCGVDRPNEKLHPQGVRDDVLFKFDSGRKGTDCSINSDKSVTQCHSAASESASSAGLRVRRSGLI